MGIVTGVHGYLEGGGVITIPGELFNGKGYTQLNFEIYARSSQGTNSIYINGNGWSLPSSSWYTLSTVSSGNPVKPGVTPPRENGYTVFLVKVKDDATSEPPYTSTWNDIIDYFSTHIDEVQLLTDGTRLNEGSADAGTMFSYSGDLNRFYFISKGKTYPLPGYYSVDANGDYYFDGPPTYCMYEEFSAHQPYGDAADVTDFYSKLLYGNSYNVIHDCQGVNLLEHYFSMSGKTGTDHRSMTNLVFWIPDHRSVANSRNYDEEYLPHVGLYTIKLEAEAEPVAYDYQPGNRNYEVTLDWVSSLNSILDFDVDQDYEVWVYVYENGVPVASEKIIEHLQDELVHNNTTYSYLVEQGAESRTIVYRIKGWPKDATNTPGHYPDDPVEGNFFALSNLDPVLIPGYNNFLALGVDHYESDFVINEEHNYYRNFLTVDNQNKDNALTPYRITHGEANYELSRFDVADPNNLTKAADLQFNVQDNKVKYNITYDGQSYIDDADQSGNTQTLTGYKDPAALGCPTSGEIANISTGSLGTITRTWDFETDQSSQFTFIDADGDNYNWYYQQSNSQYNYKTHSGIGIMTSASYVGGTVLYPNNWMISPEVTLGGFLKFWACGQDNSDNNEVFGVYVYQGTYSGGTSGFVQVGTDITTDGTMREYSFDLSAYSGKGRFAIVHHNCSDQFRLNIDDISIDNQPDEAGFTLFNNFLDNSTYTQVGIVEFQAPWKSIQVKPQEESAGSASGYFFIQNGGRLRFIMPAGYNNANLRFVIHNAPVTSEYYDGTFTLTSSTGDTQTITIPRTSGYGDSDYEVIFTGISTGDVITITGTHTVDGELYNYSPDFKYIHVYVEGGHEGISENTPLNLAAIKFVDQFKAETRYDRHAKRYGYVLKAVGSTDESAKPEVPVQHTGSNTYGYYSVNEIKGDTVAPLLQMNVMNAEVNMTLSREPEIYYYTLDRKPSNQNNAPWEEISKLQRREDDTYQEMDSKLADYNNQICNPPTDSETPWIVERYDNDIVIGGYNSFMSYVPVIWTHGDQDNRRVKWNSEKRHNSYGAPVWKTGVAEVNLISATAERQESPSTKWTYGGEDCSLYMLDKVVAEAKLPTVSNINYVPYMFRIFVKSENHKLRGYKRIADGVDEERPGSHYDGDVIRDDSLKCVWSGYVNDPNNGINGNIGTNGVIIDYDEDTGIYTFRKDKVDRSAPNGAWDKDKENAIFGGLEDIVKYVDGEWKINPQDLTIVVRFYFLVEGFNDDAPSQSQQLRSGNGNDDPAGNGAEGSRGPSGWTGLNDLLFSTTVVSVTYVNPQGMQSDRPFEGLNIVITRYSDGRVTTTKELK